MDEQKKALKPPEKDGQSLELGKQSPNRSGWPDAEIPFMASFEAAMLTGAKTATSRNKIYGHPGQKFEAFGGRFQITGLFRLTQEMVRDQHYREEGFTSPEAFEACWRKLHPRSGFKPEARVWMHKFKREAKP